MKPFIDTCFGTALGEQEVTIVIVGRPRTGKSSIVNLLIGQDLLPTGTGKEHRPVVVSIVDTTQSNPRCELVDFSTLDALFGSLSIPKKFEGATMAIKTPANTVSFCFEKRILHKQIPDSVPVTNDTKSKELNIQQQQQQQSPHHPLQWNEQLIWRPLSTPPDTMAVRIETGYAKETENGITSSNGGFIHHKSGLRAIEIPGWCYPDMSMDIHSMVQNLNHDRCNGSIGIVIVIDARTIANDMVNACDIDALRRLRMISKNVMVVVTMLDRISAPERDTALQNVASCIASASNVLRSDYHSVPFVMQTGEQRRFEWRLVSCNENIPKVMRVASADNLGDCLKQRTTEEVETKSGGLHSRITVKHRNDEISTARNSGLFPSTYSAPPIEQCLAECGLVHVYSSWVEHRKRNAGKLPLGMTEDQACAVFAYTSEMTTSDGCTVSKNPHDLLNTALRSSEGTDVYRGFIFHLLQGLRNLPIHHGIVYRGIDVPIDVAKIYKKGEKVVWNTFTSTTTSLDIAKDFSRRVGGVVFFIECIIGRRIGNLSVFPNEEEVVLEPNSEFVVCSAAEPHPWSNVALVHLKQVATNVPLLSLPNTESETGCKSPEDVAKEYIRIAISKWGTARTAEDIYTCGELLSAAVTLDPDSITAAVCQCALFSRHPAAFVTQFKCRALDFLHKNIARLSAIPRVVAVAKEFLSAMREPYETLEAQRKRRFEEKNEKVGDCAKQGNGAVDVSINTTTSSSNTSGIKSKYSNQSNDDSRILSVLIYLSGLFDKMLSKDYDSAAKHFQRAVDLGLSDAMNDLGLAYSCGNGVVEDLRKSATLFKQSGDLGHASGIYNYGVCCSKGKGTSQDKGHSLVLYLLAAAAGHTAAKFNAAVLYERGEGCKVPDPQKAREFYENAAADGYVPAMYNLAVVILGDPNAKAQEVYYALELYKTAAKAGSILATYNLAVIRERGRPMYFPPNITKAAKLYKKAAYAGNASAAYNLGVMLLNTENAKPGCLTPDQLCGLNLESASTYFKMAAANDHASSEYNLGWCFENGKGGVAVDMVVAAHWYRLALTHGCAAAAVKVDKFKSFLK